MQTFLPWPDFVRSARALDDRRLGKQRVETLQVLRALQRETYGWKNHPAVRMWRGHEEALVAYGVAVCDEWAARGCADSVRAQLVAELGREPRPQEALAEAGALPAWLGDEAFHRSHRCALVRKDRERYAPSFGELPDEPYVWPVRGPTDSRSPSTTAPARGRR